MFLQLTDAFDSLKEFSTEFQNDLHPIWPICIVASREIELAPSSQKLFVHYASFQQLRVVLGRNLWLVTINPWNNSRGLVCPFSLPRIAISCTYQPISKEISSNISIPSFSIRYDPYADVYPLVKSSKVDCSRRKGTHTRSIIFWYLYDIFVFFIALFLLLASYSI